MAYRNKFLRFLDEWNLPNVISTMFLITGIICSLIASSLHGYTVAVVFVLAALTLANYS